MKHRTKEKIPVEIQDKNAFIQLGLLDKYHGEYIDCAQITYYVDGDLQFKKPGQIMVNRRYDYPKLQILIPDTGDYTETFQEDSCIFTDLSNLDVIKIENIYTPYAINKEVKVEVMITF